MHVVEDPDPDGNNYFGESISISGDTFIVGSPFYNSTHIGNAYIYRRPSDEGDWEMVASIHGYGPTFGNSVSISGDMCIVGSQKDRGNGTAQVFYLVNNTWSFMISLSDPSGANGNLFGYSVDICDTYIVVGSPFDDVNDVNAGSVSVFTMTNGNWSHVTKLTDPDGEAFDYMGKSVAISGTGIVAGAPNDNNHTGSAVVFRVIDGSWQFDVKLQDPQPQPMRFFGASVDISGNTLISGSNFHEDVGVASVFSFLAGVWTHVAYIYDPSGIDGKRYKNGVAIDENVIAVGSPYDDVSASDSGSASVFARKTGNWTHVSKMADYYSGSRDFFGSGVSVSGYTVVASAYSHGDANGKVYATTCKPNIWSIGTIDLNFGFDGGSFTVGDNLTVTTDIEGAPYLVYVQLYDMHDVRIVPGTDCVSLASQNYSYPFTNFSFSMDVDRGKIEESNLTKFETDPFTGKSVGMIQFYIHIGAVREDNTTLAFRRLYVELNFDLTNFTFGVNNIVDEDPMELINTDLEQYQVQACECDRTSFTCFDNPSAIPQNTDLVVCLKPVKEDLRITNFAMQVVNQDNTFEYNPVSYGATTWQTNSLTDVETDPNSSTVMVITPIVAPLYDGQVNILTIRGNANLEFHTSRTSTPSSPFEVNIVIDTTVEECSGFFSTLLRSLFP